MTDEVKTYEVKLERRDICPFCNQSLEENQRLRERWNELKKWICDTDLPVSDNDDVSLGRRARSSEIICKILEAALDGENQV